MSNQHNGIPLETTEGTLEATGGPLEATGGALEAYEASSHAQILARDTESNPLTPPL